VQLLRNFRDQLVLNTQAGSAFMEVFNAWYYSFSPSVATVIAGNDVLRATMRVLLYPLLGILALSSLTYATFSAAPEFAIVMAGVVASSLIGLVYLTPLLYIRIRALPKNRKIRTSTPARAALVLVVSALALLAAGEVAGSFLLLAVGSSALVLTCLVAAPLIVALAFIHPRTE